MVMAGSNTTWRITMGSAVLAVFVFLGYQAVPVDFWVSAVDLHFRADAVRL